MSESFYADANYTSEGTAITVAVARTTKHNAYVDKTYPPETLVQIVSLEEWTAVKGQPSCVMKPILEAGEAVTVRFPDWTYRYVSTDKLSYQ